MKKFRGLSRTFQVFFLASVSLPSLFLLRLAWDHYLQSLELRIRDEMEQHRLMMDGWHGSYFYYKVYLRRLAQDYFAAMNQKPAGSSDPSVWFNWSKRFHEQFDKTTSRAKSRHIGVYSQYRTLYNRMIGRALFKDPSQMDDMKAPVKVQIYVLEKSWWHARWTENLDKQARPVLYKDLMAHAPPMPDTPFETEEQRLEWLQQAQLFHFFEWTPIHLALPSRSSALGLIFDEFVGVLGGVIKGMVFGYHLTSFEESAFRNLVQMSARDARGRWLSVRFFSKEMELYFNPLPQDFDYEAYIRSEAEAIDGLVFAILDISEARDTFFRAFRSLDYPEAMREIAGPDPEVRASNMDRDSLKSYLQKKGYLSLSLFREILESRQIEWQQLDLRTLTERSADARVMAIDRSGRLLEQPGSDSSLQNISADGFRLKQLLGVFNPQTGSYSLNRSEFRAWAQSEILSRENDPQKLLELQARLAQAPDSSLLGQVMEVIRKPVQFTYESEVDQEEWMGSLIPTNEFPNQAYLLLQSMQSLKKALRNAGFQVLALVVLALIAVAGIGQFMSRRVVRPILILTEGIRALAAGDTGRKVVLTTQNELGLLGFRFNQMADRVSNRIFDMNLIRDVNQLMNQHQPRAEIMAHLIYSLTEYHRLQQGLLSFVRGEISAQPVDYALAGDWTQASDLASLRLSLLQFLRVQDEKDKNLIQHRTVLPDSLCKELHLQGRTLLMYVREALPEHDTVMTGLMLLTMPEQQELLVSDFESLFEQARSIFHKGLLDEIQSDADKGWEIQESLMPSGIPVQAQALDVASTFIAARGLAGDYFDILGMGNRLGVSIADVSGKGIGPSLFGATSRAVLRAICQRDLPLGEQLSELNRRLCYRKSSNLFLTMFFCAIDSQSLTMEYASAGHNKMFLVRADGSMIHLSAKGLPCGLFDGGKYETKSIDLQEGDSVILYTDGVTEQENPALELYGMERFEQLCIAHRTLPADLFVRKVDTELKDFRAGVQLSDDITLIVLRIHRTEVSNA